MPGRISGDSDEVVALQDVLEKLADLSKGPGATKLPALDTLRKSGGQLERCVGCLNEVKEKLEEGDGMRKMGFRALKWPFSSKEVDRFVKAIGEHKGLLNLALTVDQT